VLVNSKKGKNKFANIKQNKNKMKKNTKCPEGENQLNKAIYQQNHIFVNFSVWKGFFVV